MAQRRRAFAPFARDYHRAGQLKSSAISTQSRARPLRKFGCGRAARELLRCFLSRLVRGVPSQYLYRQRSGNGHLEMLHRVAAASARTRTHRCTHRALRRLLQVGATRKYPLTRITRVRFFIPHIVRESEAPSSSSFRMIRVFIEKEN